MLDSVDRLVMGVSDVPAVVTGGVVFAGPEEELGLVDADEGPLELELVVATVLEELVGADEGPV